MSVDDLLRRDSLSYTRWQSHDVVCTVQSWAGDAEVLLVVTGDDWELPEPGSATQVLVEREQIGWDEYATTYTPLMLGPLTREQDAQVRGARRAA